MIIEFLEFSVGHLQHPWSAPTRNVGAIGTTALGAHEVWAVQETTASPRTIVWEGTELGMARISTRKEIRTLLRPPMWNS